LAASQHHERWDGQGYPDRLVGEEISLAGRIVAVADAYDVITSTRSYKKPMSTEAARKELVRCAGKQFDPDVVRAFLNVSIGRNPSRAGLLGWLAELPRGIGQLTAQVASSTGGMVAATALVSTAALAVSPPDVPAANDNQSSITETAQTQSSAQSPNTPVAAGRLDTNRFNAAVSNAPTTTGPRTTNAGTSTAVPISSEPSGNVPTSTAPPTALPTTTRSTIVAPTSVAPTSVAPTTTGQGSTTSTTTIGTAPVPKNDNADVTLGDVAVIDVLANDTGGLDPTTLTITIQPKRGSAIVDAGKITYTTGPGNGSTQITYQICNSNGQCATAKVNVVYH
jgi:hypothetical protein